MERNWKKYDGVLVKRGEIVISPEAYRVKSGGSKGKKRGRPYVLLPCFIGHGINL